MKFTPENFADVVSSYIDEQMKEKAKSINTVGVNANYDGALNITFDKTLSQDKEQNRVGVFLKGGVLLTEEGQRKKKQGEKITSDDYYVINPIGEKL